MLLAAAGVTAWSMISIIARRTRRRSVHRRAAAALGVLLAAAAPSAVDADRPSASAACLIWWRCWSPCRPPSCRRCGPASRAGHSRTGRPDAVGTAVAACSRICRAASGSATRTRPVSSPRACCCPCSVAVASSGRRQRRRRSWAWYLVVAAALGAALRARVWDSAPCKAWLLGQPTWSPRCCSVLFTATGSYTAAWWALAVLAVLVAVLGDGRAATRAIARPGHLLAADAPAASASSPRLSMRR